MSMVNYPRVANDITIPVYVVGRDADEAIERASRDHVFTDPEVASADALLFSLIKGVDAQVFEGEVTFNLSTSKIVQVTL